MGHLCFLHFFRWMEASSGDNEMDLVSCPNSSKDRYGNALSSTYAISQIATGCRISSIRRYRDFRKCPKVEGWDRLRKVIQQGHRPKIRSRLSWRIHDVDAKPQSSQRCNTGALEHICNMSVFACQWRQPFRLVESYWWDTSSSENARLLRDTGRVQNLYNWPSVSKYDIYIYIIYRYICIVRF